MFGVAINCLLSRRRAERECPLQESLCDQAIVGIVVAPTVVRLSSVTGVDTIHERESSALYFAPVKVARTKVGTICPRVPVYMTPVLIIIVAVGSSDEGVFGGAQDEVLVWVQDGCQVVNSDDGGVFGGAQDDAE